MRAKELIDETLKISETGKYRACGEEIIIRGIDEASEVEVYNPAAVGDCVSRAREKIAAAPGGGPEIIVDGKDSFVAARVYGKGKTIVLNFANAYHPGGGFIHGAVAQEEMLCRCSTLYRSLICDKAKEMYDYNNAHRGPDCSDYLLVSPRVTVFRDGNDYSLIKPFETAVITAAAPDLYEEECMLSSGEVEEIFGRKIENVLAVSAVAQYETIILGAWGCGAFGNDAEDVAKYFYDKLLGDGYAGLFKRIVFAIYCSRYEGNYNLTQFKKRFAGVSNRI